MLMKRLVVPVLLSLLLLCGCAHYYVIKLNTGGQITTRGKPKLKGNDYLYTDLGGQKQKLSQGRVMEIEPASMAKKESGFMFTPSK